jgi:hypothetical protein
VGANGLDVKGWIAIIITVIWGAVQLITASANSFRAAEVADVKTAVSIQAKELKETQLSVIEMKTQIKSISAGINDIKQAIVGQGRIVTTE